jgi:hypothetical protein
MYLSFLGLSLSLYTPYLLIVWQYTQSYLSVCEMLEEYFQEVRSSLSIPAAYLNAG